MTKFSRQRKTTLKWTSDGELSSIDKARILQKLSNRELTECEIACDVIDSTERIFELRSNNKKNT